MPYCTPADVRATYPALADPTTYPDALLAGLIDEFEQIAELYRGTAYLARTVTETIVIPSGNLFTKIVLNHAPVTAIGSVTLNGTVVAASSYVADLTRGIIDGNPWIGSFTSVGPTSVVVAYTHGLTAPPTPILRACKVYVRNAAKADTSGTSRDVITQAIDGAQTRYSTPDWKTGRPTGWLEVDRLLNSVADYRVPAIA